MNVKQSGRMRVDFKHVLQQNNSNKKGLHVYMQHDPDGVKFVHQKR